MNAKKRKIRELKDVVSKLESQLATMASAFEALKAAKRGNDDDAAATAAAAKSTTSVKTEKKSTTLTTNNTTQSGSLGATMHAASKTLESLSQLSFGGISLQDYGFFLYVYWLLYIVTRSSYFVSNVEPLLQSQQIDGISFQQHTQAPPPTTTTTTTTVRRGQIAVPVRVELPPRKIVLFL